MRNSVTWGGIMPTEWTKDTVFGELRGRKFPIPAGYDSYLTHAFGDYMAPPVDRNMYKQHLDPEDRYNPDSNDSF